ncbi:hypothetical protein TL16_g03906 [Triparma laevis f. inornata]|uniref:Uncharacterized protein n=2 Tax=Triparma laevis TaxID=1534972 RepID=A0A9W7KXL6_9STRA|nr:hypothetical protein TL16_g03906 [Triparma laevis f. inornata]GMI15169.1 hypothetical protein TrLO_g12238 [Triparma laevis f. longispina]
MSPPTEAKYGATILIPALLCHIGWGLYPPTARYLQIAGHLDGMFVLTTTKVLSVIVLGVKPLFDGSFCMLDCIHTRASNNVDKDNMIELDLVKDDSLAMPTSLPPLSSDHPDGNSTAHKSKLVIIQKIKVAALWGLFTTLRATMNMVSCAMTLAYNIAVINALTPLIAPILERAILGTKLPPKIFSVVLATVVGCVVIGFAQSPSFVGKSDDHALDAQDALGITIQFISVIFSNLARIVMKTSDGVLSKSELIQIQNFCSITFTAIIGLSTLGPTLWAQQFSLLEKVLLPFLFLGIAIFTLAAYFQVESVRKMGPGVYGTLSSIRVLVAVAGSYLFMREPVQNWLEWFGIILVVFMLTIYTRYMVSFVFFKIAQLK